MRMKMRQPVWPRPFAFAAMLMSLSLSLSVMVLGAEAASTAVPSREGANQPQARQGSGSLQLKDWLPIAGTISAALIAGLFAIYQLRRSTTAQRALEREKLLTARTEAELTQVRTSAREYQQQQALPFLEQLDRTLNESYKAPYLAPYFPNLGGYVPELRRYADRAYGDWLAAAEGMSRHRIRLLLVLGQERIEVVASLLTQFIDLMKKILEVRNQVWYQKASELDLWEVHRSYVTIGYRLMMEIRDAVSSPPKAQTSLSDAAKNSLAESLAIPFEKASTVSIPYGSIQEFCWIAMWEIDTRPEWQRFLESTTHATQEDFEEKLKDLTHTLYEKGTLVDVKLTKVTTATLEVPCLVVSLASAKRLEHFLDSEIETYRQTYATLWSSYRSPIEIVIGLPERHTTSNQSST